MTGRPTKLDDLRERKIVDVIRGGGSQRCAAAAAGIAMSTLTDWLARGRQDEAPFSEFSVRFKKAEAEAEEVAVKVIRDAAKNGTWQAAAWWLERRYPEWRPPQIQAQKEEHAANAPPEISAAQRAALEARLAEYEPLQLPWAAPAMPPASSAKR